MFVFIIQKTHDVFLAIFSTQAESLYILFPGAILLHPYAPFTVDEFKALDPGSVIQLSSRVDIGQWILSQQISKAPMILARSLSGCTAVNTVRSSLGLRRNRSHVDFPCTPSPGRWYSSGIPHTLLTSTIDVGADAGARSLGPLRKTSHGMDEACADLGAPM